MQQLRRRASAAGLARPKTGARIGSVALELGERYGILVAWAIVIAVFSMVAPRTFPTAANFQTIFGSQSVLLMLTMSLIVTFNAGEFDLSPGAALGFASTTFAYLNAIRGLSLEWSVVLVLVLAIGFGLLNCLLIVGLGVPSAVATLGSGTLLTGLGLALSSQIIAGIDAGFVDLVRHRALGLPTAFYVALGCCFAVYYMLEHTPFGRHLIFVGRGRKVAQLAGVRVGLVRCLALVTSAVIAFSAGILLAGFTGSADPSSGPNLLLPAFAAAFLGETAIRPGHMNVWGSFAAVYFLVTGVTGLQLIGANGWVEQAFYGCALIVAVAIAQVISLGRSRRSFAKASDLPVTGPVSTST